jgi:uncharacterized cupin superfamily protein
MPKIDIEKAPVKTGSIYPEPYNSQMAGRSSVRLADAGGLTQFGANLVRLEPGAKSSLRHWHMKEDEFVMMTKGEAVLIDDTGEISMSVGDCAAFPANDGNGHHFVNQTNSVAEFLVIGTRDPNEVAIYSDVDMKVTVKDGGFTFTQRDGSPLQDDGQN